MVVYRIGSCQYIKDLTGKGAAMYGGRWNNKDTYIVYTAQSRALALLETVVHMGTIPPAGYCMITIEIPDEYIKILPPDELPGGWNGSPYPDGVKKTGDNFVREGKYLALGVPSVIMMEECNYLLNPAHPEFKKVKIIAERALPMDERLLPPGAAGKSRK